jgi:hypothetical protein
VLITQAEFARLADVSRSAVRQAINSKLITEIVEINGKILIKKSEALQQYESNSRRKKPAAKKKPAPAATTKPAIAAQNASNGLDLLSWGQTPAETPAESKPDPASAAQPPDPSETPDYNKERALHEREKRLIAEMDRKTKEGQLAYIEDKDMAYNAVLLQLTTRAQSLHKQIKAAIPHLTHRELEKIERMISDIFESVASHDFEELPE